MEPLYVVDQMYTETLCFDYYETVFRRFDVYAQRYMVMIGWSLVYMTMSIVARFIGGVFAFFGIVLFGLHKIKKRNAEEIEAAWRMDENIRYMKYRIAFFDNVFVEASEREAKQIAYTQVDLIVESKIMIGFKFGNDKVILDKQECSPELIDFLKEKLIMRKWYKRWNCKRKKQTT